LDLGWLQREVASLLGVSKDTIRNWERNRTTPALRYVPRILEFLGYVPFEPGPSLPERLRFTRRVLGLSRRAFAGRLGVNESTVRGWETGRHRPSRRHRERIEGLWVSLRDGAQRCPMAGTP
ncbi:MAG: helix-turn-helix domain-containing protein, partial [Gemmatimonadota bacterium]